MMTIRLMSLTGLAALAALHAQTFPAEYRTDDQTVLSRIRYFAEQMSQESSSVSGEYARLIALPASRVYKPMNAQARVAALQAALPLVKQMVMSEAVQKAHDEQIARQYGAVNHGLRLTPRRNPKKRFEEMSAQMRKNPAAAQKPGFMQEFIKLQQELVESGQEEMLDSELTLFTRPLPEVKQKFQEYRQAYGGTGAAKQCFDAAAPLADSDPERLRLLTFRCLMGQFGTEVSEAEADRIRKERAQRLYDERSLKGVIRRSLKEFLATAATVDFAAETAARSGRQVFVNAAYEKKDGLWKLIYRNGKEPTEVAVQFAQAWLKELQPPAPAAAPATAAAKPAAGAKAAPAKAAGKKN